MSQFMLARPNLPIMQISLSCLTSTSSSKIGVGRRHPAQRLRGGTGLPTLQRIMASHVTVAPVALSIVAKAFLPDYTNRNIS
jgi:hypothetical protein